MMYPQNSMYAPCVLHALRYFEREQFLFLRYEDLMRMDASAIVRLVGHFTGLHVDDPLVAQAEAQGKCKPYRTTAAAAAAATRGSVRRRLQSRSEWRPAGVSSSDDSDALPPLLRVKAALVRAAASFAPSRAPSAKRASKEQRARAKAKADNIALRPMSFSGKSADADIYLATTGMHLERFFDPYNRWGGKSHAGGGTLVGGVATLIR